MEKRRTWVGAGALCALMSYAGPAPLSAQTDPALPGLLRGRVESLRSGAATRAGGERLMARVAIQAFYDARGFEPAWVADADQGVLPGLVNALRAAERHGLDPDDYHLAPIERLMGEAGRAPLSVTDLADLELLASDAFLVLGSHLLHGRVNPETIDAEWLANRRSTELNRVLDDALMAGRIEDTLTRLAPAQPRYQSMLQGLAKLRRLVDAGGWPRVPEGSKLETGSRGERVSALRSRLIASGDLQRTTGDDAEYDDVLAEAVRTFQSRHGLEVDGVVGPATLAALNVPAESRARQVMLNLERWRWLPEDLGARHIEVNIAGFDVKLVENGRTVRTHRAIVGRLYRQTPMFSGVMTYLVLSPYWHVPPTIAAVDKFPGIQRDPTSIAAQRMTLLDQGTNQRVDPSTVDWHSLTASAFNLRYRLRQDPGPTNALGAVKFMFPNRHNVYLHDTPSRELFDQTNRSFSSGCIRVENPLALAEYLLADQPEWNRARIDRVVGEGVERTVPLRQGVPVHLLYWTAWADASGTLHYRPDLYGRDDVVERALATPPPGA